MPGSRRCAWPGCARDISWRRAFCNPHWRAIPADEREARVAEVFAARSGASKVSAGDGEADARVEGTVENGEA